MKTRRVGPAVLFALGVLVSLAALSPALGAAPPPAHAASVKTTSLLVQYISGYGGSAWLGHPGPVSACLLYNKKWYSFTGYSYFPFESDYFSWRGTWPISQAYWVAVKYGQGIGWRAAKFVPSWYGWPDDYYAFPQWNVTSKNSIYLGNGGWPNRRDACVTRRRRGGSLRRAR